MLYVATCGCVGPAELNFLSFLPWSGGAVSGERQFFVEKILFFRSWANLRGADWLS